MATYREGDLEFDFGTAIQETRFDDDAVHGTSSTMKRVDFIVEHQDRFMFVEVKDPDNPMASNVPGFRQKLSSGKLITSLAGKYRDSLLFHKLAERDTKPIDYIVLLSMSSLDPALLLNKQDELQRSLPHSHGDWSEPCARACVILNLEQYKRQFGADSVRRISA